jgi:uncharacterized Fe-S center protein
LIDFAHVKGHPSCGFGAAIKNLALGCMAGETRGAMHDVMQYDQYWFPELCPDLDVRKQILAACPHNGIGPDRDNPEDIHLHPEQCNACGRCLKVAPPGSLLIRQENFSSFQEACAISTAIALSTFAPGKTTFISLATHMTPVCDCFGFTSMPILNDIGIFGSDDIVAIEKAALDATASERLLEDNIPTSMDVHTRQGHPFQQLHGPLKDPYIAVRYAEQLGLGCSDYELVDVFPVVKPERAELTYISAK